MDSLSFVAGFTQRVKTGSNGNGAVAAAEEGSCQEAEGGGGLAGIVGDTDMVGDVSCGFTPPPAAAGIETDGGVVSMIVT